MSTTLNYTDPETGKRIELDVDGWQLIIDSKSGELMRIDLVRLVLVTQLITGTVGRDPFRISLVTPSGEPPLLRDPDGWWIDFLVERR